MLTFAAIATLGMLTIQPAEARGGYGAPLAFGLLGGVALGAALTAPHYYAPYPYYAPVYAPPPVYVVPGPPPVYVAPAPQPYCREFTQSAIINGYYQETYGTACLQPDGSWQVVR